MSIKFKYSKRIRYTVVVVSKRFQFSIGGLTHGKIR